MPKQQFMERNALRQFVAAVACLALPLVVNAQTPQAQAPLTEQSALVIVVRHAEKATDDPVDPTLSPAGIKRAEALADALTNAGVGAIFATNFERTQATAAPLAARLGIKPVVVTTRRGEAAAHITEVVAAVNNARIATKGAILVVGHSNTVPLIVKALSGVTVPNICESQYAEFYLVALGSTDKAPARLVRSSYGTADAPVTADCK